MNIPPVRFGYLTYHLPTTPLKDAWYPPFKALEKPAHLKGYDIDVCYLEKDDQNDEAIGVMYKERGGLRKPVSKVFESDASKVADAVAWLKSQLGLS